MNILIASDEFKKWFSALRDKQGRRYIFERMILAEQNNFSHSKSVGNGVFEMKVDKGPGYRIYYARKGNTVYWLLNGGDKSTQQKDIQRAKFILQRLKEEE